MIETRSSPDKNFEATKVTVSKHVFCVEKFFLLEIAHWEATQIADY